MASSKKAISKQTKIRIPFFLFNILQSFPSFLE